MKIEHTISHYFQPTNFTCAHASLSMALSHFGHHITPESLIPEIATFKDDKGEICGTLTTWVCSWALRHGFGVEMYCSDSELLDLSWASLDSKATIERMKLARETRTLAALNQETIHKYFDSYIEFLELGGKLTITPFISSELIDELLARGPILATFAYSTLYGVGRTKTVGLRESVPDDLTGSTCTHAAVIYGRNNKGEYLVADPYRSTQFHVAPRDAVIAAIAAASYACESHIALISEL
jgi:hypothetical protein